MKTPITAKIIIYKHRPYLESKPFLPRNNHHKTSPIKDEVELKYLIYLKLTSLKRLMFYEFPLVIKLPYFGRKR